MHYKQKERTKLQSSYALFFLVLLMRAYLLLIINYLVFCTYRTHYKQKEYNKTQKEVRIGF